MVSDHRPAILPLIGWREWVGFPDWGMPYIKAKVDTGARTSSLHVMNLEWTDKDGERWVQFDISPWQRSHRDTVRASAQVIATRDIKSSSGAIDHRPVILAAVRVAGCDIQAELTLTNRDEMGFRMLLGREAIRHRFLIDPGMSYRGGRPDRITLSKNRGKR